MFRPLNSIALFDIKVIKRLVTDTESWYTLDPCFVDSAFMGNSERMRLLDRDNTYVTYSLAYFRLPKEYVKIPKELTNMQKHDIVKLTRQRNTETD